MARKNSQQKDGVDRTLRRHKKKGAETQSAPRGKATESKVFPQENLPDVNLSGEQCTGSTIGTDNVIDRTGVTQRTGKHVNSEKQEVDATVRQKEQSMDGIEDVSTAEGPGNGDGNVHFTDAYYGLKNRYSHLGSAINGHMQNLMENVNLSDNAIVQFIKRSAPSIMKAAEEWLDARKPWLIDVKTSIIGAPDYARTKFELAYPVVLKWLAQIGNIMLLLMMIWLDCTLRGIDSFLRMGTTSFFSFLWCGIFSAIAMVGMFKFLLVSVVAVLMGLFIGLSFALIMLAISGLVSLWFCGSFWTTILVIALGGVSFTLSHERLALFIVTVYSIYSAWTYVGWLGLLLGLNLSFISSDALIYFLRNSKVSQTRRPNKASEQAKGTEPPEGIFRGDPSSASFPEAGGIPADRSQGTPSTSGSNSEITSEDEIARLLNCSDHYSVLGLSRGEDIDGSLLKREYRRKAMLVHPDKNQGNEKAAEAFKKLQNAYEVLLDSLKRKAYDDELRREELLNYFRRFQTNSQMQGSHGFFSSRFPRTENDGEDLLGEARRIACKRCNGFHVWVLTKKVKSQARWCQDCQDYHPAKDGDGWLEQSSQPFLFGILQKVNTPTAYICADSRIYNATEWYICQGMRCPSNTHKPSFHVNTTLTSSFSKQPQQHSSSGKGGGAGTKGSGKGGGGGPAGGAPFEENMTEEEFFDWLQNAVQAGIFDDFGGSSSSAPAGSPSAAAAAAAAAKGGPNSSSSKRKKRGKKQW